MPDESKIARSRGRVAATLLVMAGLALMTGRDASAFDFASISPQASTLAPGSSETISVLLNSTASNLIGGFSLAVSYDNTRFNISNVALGPLLASTFLQSVGPANYMTGGELTTSASSGELGYQVSVGTILTLETFKLTAMANAPMGAGDVILQANYGGLETVIYDGNTGGPIALNPAPTNNYNAAIDGIVTVAVPEPSSLILLGLGGLIAATGLVRKQARLARAR